MKVCVLAWKTTLFRFRGRHSDANAGRLKTPLKFCRYSGTKYHGSRLACKITCDNLNIVRDDSLLKEKYIYPVKLFKSSQWGTETKTGDSNCTVFKIRENISNEKWCIYFNWPDVLAKQKRKALVWAQSVSECQDPLHRQASQKCYWLYKRYNVRYLVRTTFSS